MNYWKANARIDFFIVELITVLHYFDFKLDDITIFVRMIIIYNKQALTESSYLNEIGHYPSHSCRRSLGFEPYYGCNCSNSARTIPYK